MNNPLIKEHLDYYSKVVRIMRAVEHDAITTVLVGRPDEVLDDESFKWKVLKDKEYPRHKITRATYVYQEPDQVSYISVLIDFENGWAHGIVLTSLSPMDAQEWLKVISLAEGAVTNPRLPGSWAYDLHTLYE